MGFFGGIGNAIKKVGGGAAGALGMGGHGSAPPPPEQQAGVASANGAWGAGLAGAGGAMGAIANENQRTMMANGMSEADAVRASQGPNAPRGFVRGRQRMPLPSGGFGRQIGSAGAAMGGSMGGGVAYPGGSKTFDESAGGAAGSVLPMRPPDPQYGSEGEGGITGDGRGHAGGLVPGRDYYPNIYYPPGSKFDLREAGSESGGGGGMTVQGAGADDARWKPGGQWGGPAEGTGGIKPEKQAPAPENGGWMGGRSPMQGGPGQMPGTQSLTGGSSGGLEQALMKRQSFGQS